MAFGVGTHMGCEVSWTFIWRPDGAFYEEVCIKAAADTAAEAAAAPECKHHHIHVS
jgi:hypothetical protein